MGLLARLGGRPVELRCRCLGHNKEVLSCVLEDAVLFLSLGQGLSLFMTQPPGY